MVFSWIEQCLFVIYLTLKTWGKLWWWCNFFYLPGRYISVVMMVGESQDGLQWKKWGGGSIHILCSVKKKREISVAFKCMYYPLIPKFLKGWRGREAGLTVCLVFRRHGECCPLSSWVRNCPFPVTSPGHLISPFCFLTSEFLSLVN